jgi:hypothetical protein
VITDLLLSTGGNLPSIPTHVEAFPDFAAQVEKIFRQEVDVFIAEVAKEKKEKKEPQ